MPPLPGHCPVHRRLYAIISWHFGVDCSVCPVCVNLRMMALLARNVFPARSHAVAVNDR
jgi:hypothetical protein